MTHTVRNLKPCSKYQLEILPLTEDDVDLAAEPSSFMTGSPPPSPPENVIVKLNQETNKVDISWSMVECASGYRIHQNINNSDTETKWDSDELSVSLEIPEHCVTYSYGVSAMVGQEESLVEEMIEVTIPPGMGNHEHPLLVIEEKVNGSVTFIINNADKNRRCKVKQYQVKYNSIDEMIDPSSLEDGKITVEVPNGDYKIEGRIQYQDFNTWTPWISSETPRQEAFVADKDILTIIIVVAIIACVLLAILVIILICKRRKSKQKYDTEKAEGNTDESKKL